MSADLILIEDPLFDEVTLDSPEIALISQGPQGPRGPAGDGDDLPDLIVYFENGLT